METTFANIVNIDPTTYKAQIQTLLQTHGNDVNAAVNAYFDNPFPKPQNNIIIIDIDSDEDQSNTEDQSNIEDQSSTDDISEAESEENEIVIESDGSDIDVAKLDHVPIALKKEKISFLICSKDKEYKFNVRKGMRFGKVLGHVAKDMGLDIGDMRLVFDGDYVPMDAAPVLLDMEDDDRLDVVVFGSDVKRKRSEMKFVFATGLINKEEQMVGDAALAERLQEEERERAQQHAQQMAQNNMQRMQMVQNNMQRMQMQNIQRGNVHHPKKNMKSGGNKQSNSDNRKRKQPSFKRSNPQAKKKKKV